MSEAANNLEGQVVDGKFPLLRCLGESDHSFVFLTERKQEPQKVAIKLIPVADIGPATQIARWEAAAALSDPHLVRLFETGHCQIGDAAYCYVVMEYADENLYQILPDRALSPEEARALLPSLLEALRYLHKQGFVHGHIKPANILANGDAVKLSGDGVLRMGQPAVTPGQTTLYDAPEARITGLHPTRDIWSLGVTLVEALTQHPPSRAGLVEGQDILPQSLPAPFSEIARNCLRARPEQRWSLDQIAASLGSLAAPQPPALRESAKPPRPELVATSGKPTFVKPGILLASSVLAVILLGIFFVKLMHRAPAPASSSAQAPISTRETPSPETVPHAATPPSPAVVPQNAPETAAIPAPASSAPAIAAEPAESNTHGAVAEKELPEVPRSASNTIQGTIRVKVKAQVDPSGKVSSATVVSAGSSAYFAKLALQSAHKWRFTPPRRNGHEEPSAWILKFEFRRNGTRASADEEN